LLDLSLPAVPAEGLESNMGRPIWKGHISFGLVNIPVTLHTAEESGQELHFRMLDAKNKAKVKYERVNEVTGEPVPWDRIVKGYEIEDGSYVLIDEDELKKLAPEATQTVEIDSFVDPAEIDPVFFEKPYYLAPAKKGEKGYVLLREALKRTNKIGVAKVVIRTREYLAALFPRNNDLVLTLLRYKHELRDTSDLEIPDADLDSYDIQKRELDMATKLVESMTDEWQPAKYKDEFYDKAMAWIEEKAEKGDEARPPEPAAAPKQGKVIDFMDLLKRSLEEKGGKGRGRGPAADEKSSTRREPATRKKAQRKRA
jgi:DNA end-binding protein Ku